MVCIMDSEECEPDFEIGITDRRKTDESWQSGSSEEEDSESGNHRSNATTSEDQTIVNRSTTEQKIRELLKMTEHQASSSEPQASRSSSIRQRRSKRRRLSRSRSSYAGQGSQEQVTSETTTYLFPSRIAEIFDKDVSPQKLCELSALKHCSPATVLKIMPKVTVDQICQIVELQEEKFKPSPEPKAQDPTKKSTGKEQVEGPVKESTTKSPLCLWVGARQDERYQKPSQDGTQGAQFVRW